MAITFGHNKDHRPDLQQLLFLLTVTADGGVPVHFRAESCNVTDAQTHRDTWDLLCQLTGRRDFLYVADAMLATRENMTYLHQRQLVIEKRFSQLKTDFEVAPVYLKAVHRIQALLGVYFFALLVEALLERELWQAMRRHAIEALPLYPAGRACRWPTARRVIDLFELVQRHTLVHRQRPAEVLVTELTRLQRRP